MKHEPVSRLQDVTQFNRERGQETLHPLVSVLDQSKSRLIQPERFFSDLYLVFLKDEKCADIWYGRSQYDYQDQTLIFIAPGQLAGMESAGPVQPNGWALAFHPEFIRGTSLGRHIRDYHFFSYDSHEALHVSTRERAMLIECFEKIRYELLQTLDKHSRKLILNNIELLLNYCDRFYDRQFVTRERVNKDIITRFEALLNDYMSSEKPLQTGVPTVGYCADQLHLSASYFGDLVRKVTGRSAQEFIQARIIEMAKDQLADSRKTISEIAYSLGFKYPQHFTRLFKNIVGQPPHGYRTMNS